MTRKTAKLGGATVAKVGVSYYATRADVPVHIYSLTPLARTSMGL